MGFTGDVGAGEGEPAPLPHAATMATATNGRTSRRAVVMVDGMRMVVSNPLVVGRIGQTPEPCRQFRMSLQAEHGAWSMYRALGVDAVSRAGVVSAPVEQVARHVLQPEAVRQMVQNAAFYPRQAVALGTVSGRGVPTTR